MTSPYEPLPDDYPIDPNPSYPVPPFGDEYPPQSAPLPPQGYPAAYPPPWDSGRPGGLMGSSVLGYIDAGLLILAGLLLLIGASAVDSWNNAFGSSDQGVTAELAVDGLINLVSAGLQVAGGVMMSSRIARGRNVFSLGAGICIAAGIYWALRVHDGGIAVLTAVFIALPIIGLLMAWTPQATVWLQGGDPRQGAPRAFGT
jgi:hypothetical protein